MNYTVKDHLAVDRCGPDFRCPIEDWKKLRGLSWIVFMSLWQLLRQDKWTSCRRCLVDACFLSSENTTIIKPCSHFSAKRRWSHYTYKRVLMRFRKKKRKNLMVPGPTQWVPLRIKVPLLHLFWVARMQDGDPLKSLYVWSWCKRFIFFWRIMAVWHCSLHLF